MKRLTSIALAGMLLAGVACSAFAATPAAAPKRAASAAANLPFWTGKPGAAAFKAAQAKRLAGAKALIAQMAGVKGPRTIANTLQPYDDALNLLEQAGSQSLLISETSPNQATREAAEKCMQDVSAYATELSLDRRVYDALAALDVSKADAETQFYVTRTLRDFRLAGVDKDDATRQRIRDLSDSLTLIGQEFGRNIREDKSTVVCTADELEGMPADWIAGHKPGADGKITLTCEYPDAVPVFNYAKNESLRKRMFMAYNNRAYPSNIGVLDRMRMRRHELATTMGFSSFADYVTADKMVGSATNARDFIGRVVAASQDKQVREYQQLLARKQKDVPGATEVNFWEVNYYKEAVRRTDYNFDSQSIRPYLPFDKVKQGVLDVTAKLFSVEFRRVPNAPVWDPSVECYEMFDGGKLAGRFYLDMHPRANKYNHAAQFDIRTGIAGKQIPEAALVCNLPGGKPGDPGLCEYDDVETFFHEFGHLLHTLFAGGHQWTGVGGIKTERDFVEAPSQMLEEWVRSPQVLAMFAKHYQTGEAIPATLVQQMNRANAFAKALDVRRQMVYAGTSLACYDRDPSTLTTDAIMTEMTKKYQPYPFVDGTHFQCAFGHLDGYSAVYYTYMWSLVIAKDFYSQFDHADMMAPGVAKRYRDTVLAPGGSKPAAQLVSDFLGRPFNETGWKKWLDSDE